MNEEKIVYDLFRKENALWSFDYTGDKKAPHAEWSSGLCADGYTNCRPVLSNPSNTSVLAALLIAKFRGDFSEKPTWVVGSAYSSITLSFEVARQLGARHGFTKKSPADPKTMVWNELVIPSGSIVLQCEELIGTLRTTREVKQVIAAGNPNPIRFLTQVVTIFHYPTIAKSEIFTIKSLATRKDIMRWPKEDCPLCAQGSPRLPPAQNWEKFISKGKHNR